MSIFIPESIDKTVRMIALMNITTESSSSRIDFRTTRTTYTYTQQWKPMALLALISFLREKVPTLADHQDAELIQYITDIGKDVLTEKKDKEHARRRFGLFYFLGSIWAAVLLITVAAGDYADFIPSWARILTLVLVAASCFLVWLNRIRFEDIEGHLRNDSLTKEDCIYVCDQLPKKELTKKMRYGLGAGMVLAAVILVLTSGRITKSNLEKSYAQIEASFDKNILEIDTLIEERSFADAWAKTEEYYREASEVEKALRMSSHKISDAYYDDCQRKIMRSLVCGFWTGKSNNPDYPYRVIYITESDEGYWDFVANQEFSEEQLLEIVEKYKTEYYFPAESVSISKGAVKAVTFYLENGKLELKCRSFPEEILEVDGEELLRVE